MFKSKKNIYILLATNKMINGFVSISLLWYLTSVMPMETYGLYSLSFGIVVFLSNLFFQWQVNVIQKYYAVDGALLKGFCYNNIKKIIYILLIALIFVEIIYDKTGWWDNVFIFIYVIALGIYMLTAQYVNSQGNYGRYVLLNNIKNILFLIFSIIAWSFGENIPILLGAGALAYAVSVIYVANLKISKSEFLVDGSVNNNYWIYGKYFLIISILTSVIDFFDRIVISHFMLLSDVGVYSSVQTILQQLIGALMSIFYAYWSPKILDKNTNSKISSNTNYSKMCFDMMAVGGAGVLFLNVFMRDLLRISNQSFISVDEWACYVITISIFTSCLKGYLVDVRSVLIGDSRAILYSTACIAVLNIILNCILIPIYGVLGAALSSFFAFYLGLIYSLYMIWRRGTALVEAKWLIISPLLLLLISFIFSKLFL